MKPMRVSASGEIAKRIVLNTEIKQMDKICHLAMALFIAWLPLVSKSQEVRALRPLITEENAIVQPQIEGRWIFDFSATDTLSITKKGDNFYHLELAKTSSKYEAMLGKLGNITVLQLLPMPAQAHDTRVDFIPVYTFFKVESVDDTLHLAGINYKWVFEHIKRDTAIQYIWSHGALVLNISTPRLQQFISVNKDHERFFEDKMNFARLHPVQQARKRDSSIKTFRATKQPATFRQDCLPSFPLKKGWFGGDGNVSVAISATRTLWLFSDSFVGGEEQPSREGSYIIANSVGVMDCEKSGLSTIEYYWKEKFTPNPQPIFESFTGRYKFWVNDALLYDSALYIVLDKIGSRSEPTAVDETFNFQHIGWTLARVDNPYDLPDRWKIDYLPITGIADKQWNGQFVPGNGYVYFFFRKDSASILTRAPIGYVESPLDSIQYYSTNNTWNRGTGGDDAAILFWGDDCQTVEYHPGIKKWIMIIGPGFWSNKIRMRQAAELTGPWSDEIIVYQCPEQTPASTSYHKDNFCYLGREHIQFYDPKTRKMLLTYDHNTVDFKKLLSDTSIYVPKVISVQIPK